MHFFNPAPVMRLVEVVSGLATDPQVAEAVVAVAAAWGKTPVRVTSTPGFIVNRVARPFYGEALRALDEGAADPPTIDAVFREAGGFRMGPLELTDLIGQDVNLAVGRSVWELFGQDPRYAPSLAQQALVDAGRLGRKTGEGFYSYAEGTAAPAPVTAADTPAAAKLVVTGDWGPWRGLWNRLSDASIEITYTDGVTATAELPGGAVLVPTDGRTATELASETLRPVVTLDLALDPSTASRFAIAASDNCPPLSVAAVIGLLQATDATVSVLDDLPGLLVARTAAMLVNEAADVVGRQVASAADVDTAMCLGVGYPIGPLAWGDRLGAGRVVELLDALALTYGDGRYRASPTLRRAAWSGRSLRER
jgi:3-hydroxybutyryl-CoA dehydrogenase